MAGLTRGPLAAEVYWRRRLLVLGLALLLVLAIARVLGSGSDARDPGRATDRTATQAGAAASVTPGATAATTAAVPPAPTPSTAKQLRQARKAERAAKKAAEQAQVEAAAASASAAAVAALPDPQGPCGDTDVVVTPTIPSPVAGSDVAIDLQLTTYFSPACSWKVSPDSLALKITSGDEDIWSSQQCPKVIPTQDVVLRRAAPTTVQVVWNAKRSDDDCSPRTTWALPGYYHLLASALAGEPSDLQFELTTPVAPTVTKTADPNPPTKSAGKKKSRG